MAGEVQADKDLSVFAEAFAVKISSDGMKLSKKHLSELQKFAAGHKDLIEQATALAPTLIADAGKLKGKMRDRFMADVQAEVWKKRRPTLEPGKVIHHGDGLDISDRIWRMNDTTKRGLNKVLSNQIRFGRAVDSSLYSMQYWVEGQAGKRFSHFSLNDTPKWMEELRYAGHYMSNTPTDRKAWKEIIGKLEGYVAERAKNGTYYAGKQLIKQVRAGAAAGKEEMVERAMRYWLYDRQKYFLKRIVRTEAANAFHISQIQATEHDPALAGYQWRLSSAHPKKDICDEWADIDKGLGRGVWPKDEVPRAKPHPQCMCYLIPRFGGRIRQKTN